ncbi:MAG: acyl-CoA dehydratase activase-related protein [Bacillota bacterium]
MIKRIGIPRALMFYEYYPLWVSFFEALGVAVLVSEKTNKRILDEGIKSAVDEACLPVQLFHGHVMNIKDKVDYLFIPRLKSIHKGEYICPKFCGLPEMIRHSIAGLPEMIDTEIDMFRSEKELESTFLRIGKYFTTDIRQIQHAFMTGVEAYKQYKKRIFQGDLPIDSQCANEEKNEWKRMAIPDKNVMVMGHPYHLYDTFMNMNTISKIRECGIDVLTPEMIDSSLINHYAERFDGKLYWTFARRLIGAAYYLIENQSIDGIIYISTFGCGIDSVVADIIEKQVRRKSNIPFMLLTIDEHSGEAGINTRIEAFLDMIRWRGRHENHIPAHG